MIQYLRLAVFIFISSIFSLLILSFFTLKNHLFEQSKTVNLTLPQIVSAASEFKNPNFVHHLSNQRKVEHFSTTEKNVDHCVLYNFLKHQQNTSFTENGTTYEPISLALHSTLNYVHLVANQADSWSDLISYSIFLFPGNEKHLRMLKKIHSCHFNTNQKVSIHLVWTAGFLQSSCINDFFIDSIQKIADKPIDCTDFNLGFLSVELKELDIPLTMYPINLMRNEARRGAHSKLQLVADVETMFSANFAKKVRPMAQQLLSGKLEKSVLVYRRFEVEESEFPKNVQELWDSFKSKNAFEFHSHFYKPGHVIANLTQWFDYSINNEEIIVTEIPYTRQEWEPQFIMTMWDPFHLEFVPTRFNDQQSLSHILCRANYSFLIMSHVFNVHPGIKRGYTPVEEALTKLGKRQSAVFLRRFNDFLDKYYPRNNLTNKCPKMTH